MWGPWAQASYRMHYSGCTTPDALLRMHYFGCTTIVVAESEDPDGCRIAGSEFTVLGVGFWVEPEAQNARLATHNQPSRNRLGGLPRKKNPRICPRVIQATLVVASGTGSGAGPQIYAEKIGRASLRSPRDMMIPIGSSDSVISRTFFILFSLYTGSNSLRARRYKALMMPEVSDSLSR